MRWKRFSIHPEWELASALMLPQHSLFPQIGTAADAI